MKSPTLIILSGLPGVGKSTIARRAAAQLPATWVRIDTIEQALVRAGLPSVTHEGYAVGHAIAADLLRTGQSVIADSVNPIAVTRASWRAVAEEVGVRCVEVGLHCADAALHRHRVDSRAADIPGHAQPTWQDVVDRAFEPFPDHWLVLDTAIQSPEACVDLIRNQLI